MALIAFVRVFLTIILDTFFKFPQKIVEISKTLSFVNFLDPIIALFFPFISASTVFDAAFQSL
jgi:hypothetical protein